MIAKPMLASQEIVTKEMLGDLRWPKIGSIKKDGYRCLLLAREKRVQPMSRSFTPIPNCHIHAWAEDMPSLLDGELVIPGHTFHQIQSKLNSHVTVPFKFRFYVFDHLGFERNEYGWRLKTAERIIERYDCPSTRIMPYEWLDDPDEAWAWYQKQLEKGEEGIILRDPNAPYKQGRATFRQEWMLKMKEYVTRECVIIGMVEAEENLNEMTRSNTGYAKRSSKKANKRPKNTLGALVVRDLEDGTVFNIGSGWTADQGWNMWQCRDFIVSQEEIHTYKKAVYGEKDKPRQPIWVGRRAKADR